ncbi:hypothetical protein BESB_004050 [Besnoitia besnoiti]|uniref:Transporter n=1 Tax=Besnoitia besnoiti TaxID=94643 RepID=A0A2A9MLD4_BESBE|nr:hypothetical protein BESB_004050 [Besnoitia besnoiti]PFH38064.1 hypothetical protein BESB_004050 [Besnoitia besnoiti]
MAGVESAEDPGQASSRHSARPSDASLQRTCAPPHPPRPFGAPGAAPSAGVALKRRRRFGVSACLHALRGTLPRNDLPGANQKTPLGLNRYVLLLVYVLYVTCTGVFFHGWPAVALLIFQNEGFQSLCARDPETGDYVEDRRVEGKPYICDNQDAAVQKLYTMTSAICSTMCAFAGALLDYAGPRWTAVLGQTGNFLGWLCLSFSYRSDAFYYVGLTLIALGADTAFLPTFSLTRLFPGSGGLILTILGSAVSASYALPLILNAVIEAYRFSFQSVALVYACMCPLMCILIALVLMPRNGFVAMPEEPDPGEETYSPPVGRRGDALHGDQDGERDTSSCDGGKAVELEAGISGAAAQQESVSASRLDAGRISSADRGGIAAEARLLQQASSSSDTRLHGGESSTAAAEGAGRSGYGQKGTTECERQAGVSGNREGSWVRQALNSCGGPRMQLFYRQFLSERYALIVLYKVGVVLTAAYFQQASRRLFSEDVVHIRGVILPFAFIPCILLGKLADVIGICRVLFLMVFFGVGMYGFSLSSSFVCGCISVVLFMFYMSLYSSQVFVYVESTFSPDDFGKLGGLTLMIGGLLMLVMNPLYVHVTLRMSRGDPFSMQIAMLAVLALQFVWISRLYILWKRDPHPFEPLKATHVAGLQKVRVHSDDQIRVADGGAEARQPDRITAARNADLGNAGLEEMQFADGTTKAELPAGARQAEAAAD